MEQISTKIFETNGWRNNQSLSGPSSTLERTANLRHSLASLLEKYHIHSMLDAPCGDLNWMRCLLDEIEIEYTGADIVEPMIQQHQEEFADHPLRHFAKIDITREKLPNADLMICRDFLFHMSYSDSLAFIKNFCQSNIKYLLTTTHINNKGFENQDIVTGHWRSMDLTLHPYLFTDAPLEKILDGGGDRYMNLWSRDQIIKFSKKFSDAINPKM